MSNIHSADHDEMSVRKNLLHRGKSIDRPDRVHLLFQIADDDARIMVENTTLPQTFFIGQGIAAALERVARRHQPPDAVQLQHLHCHCRNMDMPRMRRIERSAKDTDPHPAPAMSIVQMGWGKKCHNEDVILNWTLVISFQETNVLLIRSLQITKIMEQEFL